VGKLTDILHRVSDRTWLGSRLTGLTGGTFAVDSVVVTAGGTGYTTAPGVSFTGGGGSGAAGTAVIAGGAVISVTMTAAGTGYTSAPTVSFSGGGGSGAAATAVILALNLDAIPTLQVAVTPTLIVQLFVSSMLSFYRLRAGTDAESSPSIIRPDDYAAATNEKVWELAGVNVMLDGTHLTLDQGTITADEPLIDGSTTWNNAGVVFNLDKLDVTNTASSASSALLDRMVGGVSRFRVNRLGNITFDRIEADTVGVGFIARKRGTTGSASAAVGSGDSMAAYQFFGWDGSAYGEAVRFQVFTNELFTGSARGAQLRISTTTTATTTLTERIRIEGTSIQVFTKMTVKAGTGAGTGALGGRLASSTTQTGNTAATETDLFTTSILSSTLATNADGLEFSCAGTFAVSASVDKRVRVKFGATTMFDTGALAATAGADWHLHGTIIRTGAATQKAVVSFTSSFGTFMASAKYTTPAETLSGAVTFKVTGEATLASDVVGELFIVDWTSAA
jgi:hypothetical protein